MPYDMPTVDQFRVKFPTFSGVGDPTMQAAIDEALASIDQSWIEADFQPAILYLAAHIMAADGVLFDGLGLEAVGGVIAAGQVSEAKVGDAMVKLSGAGGGSGGGGSASGYASTPYGQRYLSLLRRNQPAIALV